MSSATPSQPASSALEAELQALRAENARLRTAATRQQALDAQYQLSQARFRTVFENSPLGHKIIAPDLTILQANPALAAMLGLAGPEELVGRRILEFADPDHNAGWHELQTRLWAHKLPNFTLETCLRRPDGTSFWCQVTAVLFQDDGGELGYTTLEDISDRKKLALSHQRLYDAQETILHLVAHDLRNPIAHIQMVVELLRRDEAVLALHSASNPEGVLKFLNLVDHSCDQAHALLNDVLYLGQLEASRLEEHHTDLNAFLDERLAAFRLAARERGIELVLTLPPQAQHANIHPDKFGRILDNLLSNALKFTPAGGRVSVRLEKHPGHIRLVVHDTGLGIPEALQPHVFDKFSSAKRPGLYGDTTTGLGLFITKQIVELHQGQIWLESYENRGTTFFIDLT
ncbi:PAS domain-containing sensor histidine kinase [Hymenobacter chitinivorans]|uniref:histidine kinase n=1 Tax=Hymenobacter chitinivorans DSM 11115 TaxID=1121954 RepID=A0A2M9BSL4_9BACT|nr:PAS domain-containing sensor histidine kinase [Hymenobacter chitinivorans]PJJ60938.1 two-component system sensor histidine kinase VicK [Hymenobacter chitinivorans DSM 11115]